VSVGRVLSQWECVEIQLGYIYAAADGQHGDWDALQEYGKGTTTAQRLGLLQSKLEGFFVKRPSQEAEGRTNSLITMARDFAARRHDVAHGVVRDNTWARWRIPPDPRDTTGFFLLPSHYRRKAYDDDTAFPVYAYTTPSLEKLRHQLILLETEAFGVAAHLDRHASGSRK
jgi:hypothetical protein